MPLLSSRCTAPQRIPCRLWRQCSTACWSPTQRRTCHTRPDLPHLGTDPPHMAHTLYRRMCRIALPHMLCSSRPLCHSTYQSLRLRHKPSMRCAPHCLGIAPPHMVRTPPSMMRCTVQPRTPHTWWRHYSPVCSSSIRSRTRGTSPWTQSCIGLPHTPCMLYRQREPLCSLLSPRSMVHMVR